MHAGCQFSQLGGSTHVVYMDNAPLRVVNTTFSDNTGASDESAVIYTYLSSGVAWLQKSALINNSVALPLIASHSSDGFVSDVPREFYSESSKGFKDASRRPGEASVFLNGDERWLKDVQAGFPGVTVNSEAQDEPGTTQVTIVTTPQELQASLASSARHIELQAHLDLRDVDAAGLYSSSTYLLGTVRSGTHTLRGNCSTAVDSEALQLEGAALRPLAEGQCLIVADDHMLLLMHGRLWVDNLYLRVQHTSRSNLPTLLSLSALGGRLWLTRSTLQGDARGAPQGANGIWTDTSNKVFAQGVQFVDLGGGTSPVYVQSIASFLDCTFSGNSVNSIDHGIVLADGSAQVWLQSCELVNNTATFDLVALPYSTFYSDGLDMVYSVADSAETQPQSGPQNKSIFLAFEDIFITDAETEVGQLPREPPPRPPPSPPPPTPPPPVPPTQGVPDTSDSDHDVPIQVIIPIVGAILLCMGPVIAAMIMRGSRPNNV
eukprot:jgi/Ulvmu1/8589/UM045_0032.1